MLLTQSELDQFHLFGFVKGPRVLDDARLDELREQLRQVAAGRSASQPVLSRNLLNPEAPGSYAPAPAERRQVVLQIVNIWEASPAFLAHARNPEITQTVAALCNNTEVLRIWHDQVQYKPPRIGGPTGWHQDHPAWPLLVPADLVSAWVALDDAEVDNGCMWMVPGSHRWGRVPLQSGEGFVPVYDPALLPPGVEVKAQPFCIKRGQVGFHHCMTWHGSPANKSERPRRAIAVHYMPNHVLFKPTGRHPMEKHVTVQPGESLAGPKFPVVYERSTLGVGAAV